MESFVNRMKMIADIFDAPVRSSVVRRCLKRQNQDKIPFKTKSQPNCFPGHFPFAFYSLISLKTSLFSSEIEEPGDDEKCIRITPRLCLPKKGIKSQGRAEISFVSHQTIRKGATGERRTRGSPNLHLQARPRARAPRPRRHLSVK